MNMQHGHDAKVQTLNPTYTRIRQAKLTEVYISLKHLLTPITRRDI